MLGSHWSWHGRGGVDGVKGWRMTHAWQCKPCLRCRGSDRGVITTAGPLLLCTAMVHSKLRLLVFRRPYALSNAEHIYYYR